jgi:hypothetical protein
MASKSELAATSADTLSSGAKSQSFQSWLAVYGDDEYTLYKKANATPHLNYESWVASEHVLGPYLYRITLNAWNEASSSVCPGSAIVMGWTISLR